MLALLDLELEQLYARTIFLYRDLEDKNYMSEPKGYIIVGKENKVCRLRKSLYDLKKSSRH